MWYLRVIPSHSKYHIHKKSWSYCESFFLLLGCTTCVISADVYVERMRAEANVHPCISTSAHNQRCIIGPGFQTLSGLVFGLWGMLSLTAESYNCSDVIHLKVQRGPFSSGVSRGSRWYGVAMAEPPGSVRKANLLLLQCLK